ncbi:hypothetical protein COCOBI_05-6390 [Coccomyxa sp. Obi]|nr:hypothetical protein COCOBI_05-6390 [Coccomyxa sp. Obi]
MELALIGGTEHPVQDLALREELMKKRRKDQERHYSKQIWTKQPHGGPYVKCDTKSGYDPLIELPNGNKRAVALGYERPQRGPTTNFVGNHMTQGAIDLVQMELKRPGPPKELRDVDWYEKDANALSQMPAMLAIEEKRSDRVREDSSSRCTPDLAALRRVLRSQRASSGATAAGAPLGASLADSSPEAQLAPVGVSESQMGGITEDTGAQQHVPAHATTLLSMAKQVQSLTAEGDEAARLGDHNRALQLFSEALAACDGAAGGLLSTAPASMGASQSNSDHSLARAHQNAVQLKNSADSSGIDSQAADCARGHSAVSKEAHYCTGHTVLKEVAANVNEMREPLTGSSKIFCHSGSQFLARGVVMGRLHLKRAACHVHMGAHGAASADCTLALDLAGEESAASSAPDLAAVRVAALLQRGLAAEVLERFGHSKCDFLAVLSLDPSNRMVRHIVKTSEQPADLV